jgi:hypothetical protein
MSGNLQDKQSAALRVRLHSAEQTASSYSDWFELLVEDLAKSLQCEAKPHIILAKLKHQQETLALVKKLSAFRSDKFMDDQIKEILERLK